MSSVHYQGFLQKKLWKTFFTLHYNSLHLACLQRWLCKENLYLFWFCRRKQPEKAAGPLTDDLRLLLTEQDHVFKTLALYRF